MTNQENEEVIRCRTCYIALTGGSPTPLHCPLAVYAISSLDTGSPLSYRTQNMQPRRDTPGIFCVTARAKTALKTYCLRTESIGQ